MNIEKISINKIPEPNFKNTILNRLIGVFMIPFAIIIVIPIVYIYSKIKEFVFGVEEVKKEVKESVFFENEKYKFIREIFEFESDNTLDNIAENFLWTITDYDDEYWIFKLISKKENSDLVNYPFTNFKIETFDELILQRIYEKNGEPTSDLISFLKSDGTIKILTEIGQFGLDKYDKKSQIISGHNKKQEIKIKVTELSRLHLLN